MVTDKEKPKQPRVQLPKHLLLFCLLFSALTPFVARIIGVPCRGWGWFKDYFPGLGGLLFFSAFNLIPGGVLYCLGKGSKRKPLPFWFALAAGIGFLLYAHGTINIRSNSTAAIGLIFIPTYGIGAAVIGWVVGFVVNSIVKVELVRTRLRWIVLTTAILFGVGNAVYESRTSSVREARFPVVLVNELQLSKRVVYPSIKQGRIDSLALGNFDKILGDEIAVLSNSKLLLLNPRGYVVKSQSEFKPDECEGCVHMYPYLVPDGKGNVLVATSDGLADNRGHLLWRLKATGFTHLVPIQTSSNTPIFIAEHNNERVDCHDVDGKVWWSAKLAVSGISTYVTSNGVRMPAVQTGYAKSTEIHLYDVNGKNRKTIKIPEWGSYVEEVAWPTRGHLLVGAGNSFGVLDSEGKEVLRHLIKDTSFSPYHGPEGTAVLFNGQPYLAVMNHGSSGYPRSVLLIFDPKGRLVWQEEMRKLSSILSVPQVNGKGEVLLVGGLDGITEYGVKLLIKPHEEDVSDQ